jgi:hypothetical protein
MNRDLPPSENWVLTDPLPRATQSGLTQENELDQFVGTSKVACGRAGASRPPFGQQIQLNDGPRPQISPQGRPATSMGGAEASASAPTKPAARPNFKSFLQAKRSATQAVEEPVIEIYEGKKPPPTRTIQPAYQDEPGPKPPSHEQQPQQPFSFNRESAPPRNHPTDTVDPFAMHNNPSSMNAGSQPAFSFSHSAPHDQRPVSPAGQAPSTLRKQAVPVSVFDNKEPGPPQPQRMGPAAPFTINPTRNSTNDFEAAEAMCGIENQPARVPQSRSSTFTVSNTNQGIGRQTTMGPPPTRMTQPPVSSGFDDQPVGGGSSRFNNEPQPFSPQSNSSHGISTTTVRRSTMGSASTLNRRVTPTSSTTGLGASRVTGDPFAPSSRIQNDRPMSGAYNNSHPQNSHSAYPSSQGYHSSGGMGMGNGQQHQPHGGYHHTVSSYDYDTALHRIRALEMELSHLQPNTDHASYISFRIDPMVALQRQVAELQQELKNREKATGAQYAQSSSLEEQHQRLQVALKEEQEAFQLKMVEMDNLSIQLKASKDDVAKRREECDALKKELGEIEAENRKLMQRNGILEQQLKSDETRLQEIERSKESQASNLAQDFKRELEAAKQTNTARSQRLEGEVEQLQAKLSKMEEVTTDLKKAKGLLEQEKAELQQQLSTAETEVANLNGKLKQSNLSLDSDRTRIRETTAVQHQKHAADLQNLQQQLEDLREKHAVQASVFAQAKDAMEREIGDLKDQLALLNTTLEKTREHCSSMEAMESTWKSEAAEASQAAQELRSELASAGEKNRRLERDLVAEKERAKSLAETVEQLKERSVTQERTLIQLEVEKKELQRRVDATQRNEAGIVSAVSRKTSRDETVGSVSPVPPAVKKARGEILCIESGPSKTVDAPGEGMSRVLTFSAVDDAAALGQTVSALPEATLCESRSNEPLGPNITHLVTSGKITVKLLSALIRGCWVMPERYIKACGAAKAWLPEEEYGVRLESSPIQRKKVCFTQGFMASKHPPVVTALILESGGEILDYEKERATCSFILVKPQEKEKEKEKQRSVGGSDLCVITYDDFLALIFPDWAKNKLLS